MLLRARGLLSLRRFSRPTTGVIMNGGSSGNKDDDAATPIVVVSRFPEVLIERPARFLSSASASAAATAAPGQAEAAAAAAAAGKAAPSVERPSDGEPDDDDDDHDDDGVRILRLNAPDALNCLSYAMADGFGAAIAELRATRGLRAVVVTGAGRGFCAGGSYDFIRERLESGDPAGNARALEALYLTFLSLRTLPVPVIAAVNGPAVGGGCGIVLACDAALISTTAKIGLNFVRLGITPGMAASALLPQATSHAAACRLLLTGDVVGADEAVRLGLALEAHPPDQLLPAALSLARRMAAGCPRAVRETLSLLRSRGGGYGALLEAAKQEAARQGFHFTRPDAKEGLAAVQGKRPARWQTDEEAEEQ